LREREKRKKGVERYGGIEEGEEMRKGGRE